MLILIPLTKVFSQGQLFIFICAIKYFSSYVRVTIYVAIYHAYHQLTCLSSIAVRITFLQELSDAEKHYIRIIRGV